MKPIIIAIAFSGVLCTACLPVVATEKQHDEVITPTGLVPAYPPNKFCSGIKSLYASMVDIDGLPREEKHSGIDAGRLGEPILAPASGVVLSAWVADWGWGEEGALLIRHTRQDLNREDGASFYYSAFYHLKTQMVENYKPGQTVTRGEELATVFRPGGKKQYLPEVHWETWAVSNDTSIEWKENELGYSYWVNKKAELVDPLQLLGLHTENGTNEVMVTPYEAGNNYSKFKGFTYIFSCN